MQSEIPRRLKRKKEKILKTVIPSKRKTNGQVIQRRISKALKDDDSAAVQLCL